MVHKMPHIKLDIKNLQSSFVSLSLLVDGAVMTHQKLFNIIAH